MNNQKQDDTPPIIRWLYRHIFRGFGWVFIAGMLTALLFHHPRLSAQPVSGNRRISRKEQMPCRLLRSRKRLLIVALSVVITAPVAYGLFGLGDIVYDPTNGMRLVQQISEMEQQYSQLVRTYQMVTNQYNQMLWMSKMIPANLRARYRALATPWKYTSATNTYGTTGGWINAVDTGSGVSTGYGQATHPLNVYGPALSNIPVEQLPRVQTQYATVELTDGANLAGIDLLGRIRSNAPQVESSIQSLENDSLSTDPDLNTEIAVLNKINSADLISIRNTQDTNKLLAALAEQQIIDVQAQAGCRGCRI